MNVVLLGGLASLGAGLGTSLGQGGTIGVMLGFGTMMFLDIALG